MKKHSYSERDYAFGQTILTLRTNIGLTQAGLAEHLGVSRRAMAEWEAGSSYPKAEHLKQLIALGVQQRAFSVEHEAEEVRTLWNVAHQKMLLDEVWLQELLGQPLSPLALPAPHHDERTDDTHRAVAPPDRGRREDWGNALAVPNFYGREEELTTLARWVLEERCRMVSILGLGGIGKSTLAVSLASACTTLPDSALALAT